MQQRVSLMMRAVFRRLIAVSACAALLLGLASPAFAEPAMWVVKDEDSTIYLLGTFHVTKPGMQWRSEKIDAAFKNSDELWLEATVDENAPELQASVLKYGFDRKKPLSSKLSSDDWTKMQSAATLAGLHIDAIDQMRPWFAAVSLVLGGLMKEGYDPLEGADKQLAESARASQKIVRTFETPEQQMLYYASLPEQSEIAFLVRTLDELGAGSRFAEYVDGMTNAWLAGDTDELEAMTLEKMKTDTPELYDTLFVRRNMDWCDQIAGIMKGAGTSFVAVGAGHLIGDQSVPAILAERGFTVAPY